MQRKDASIAHWKKLLEILNAEKLSDKAALKHAAQFDAVTERIVILRAEKLTNILDKIFVLKYFVQSGARDTASIGIASIEKDLNLMRLSELLERRVML